MSLITITHSIGSRGRAIAQQVGARLGLPIYDDAALEKIARDSGMDDKALKGLDESAPGLLSRFLSANPVATVDLMESLIYKVSHQGRGIIIGHGSQILLHEFDCAFHVRIHAPESARIREVARRRELTPGAAGQLVRKMDDRQKGFFKYAFGLDWHEPSLYDLIINTGKMGVDTAAGLIAEAAVSDDFTACTLNALDAMANLSLEKKVHAQIVRQHIDLENITIAVPEKGRVRITGLVSAPEDRQRIRAAVAQVAEATDVDIDVAVFTGGHI